VIFLIGAGAFYVVNQQVISNSPDKQTATALALLPNATATISASSTSAPSVTPIETVAPTVTPTGAPTETLAPSATPTTQPTDEPTIAPTQTAAVLSTDNLYEEFAPQILQLVRDGQLDVAMDAIAKPLADDPQSYILQQLYAYVLVQYREDGEKLEMAKQMAETGIAAAPERPEAYYVLGQYWGASPHDDYAKALELTTQAIDKGMTNFADAYLFHGTMLYYTGGSPDAILDDLGKAIALEPKNEALYRRRGYYYLNDLYRLPEAQADLEQALALEPNNIYDVHAALAWIYIKQDKPDAAFELFRKAIQEDLISSASYLADGAIIAWQTGHIPEAEKWATDAHAIDPSFTPATYALALVAWAKDEDEEALNYFDEISSSADPGSYHQSVLLQWYRLGRELEMDRAYILIEQDRKDEAIPSLKLAVDNYGDWIDPYLQLAKLYIEDDANAEARDILQRALDVATRQKDAEAREQVLSMLKELGD
jgi:tetratricopeptide (TPR) repeat protein